MKARQRTPGAVSGVWPKRGPHKRHRAVLVALVFVLLEQYECAGACPRDDKYGREYQRRERDVCKDGIFHDYHPRCVWPNAMMSLM